MHVRYILIIFFIIFQIILTRGKKSGPYKTTLLGIGPCPRERTTKPMDNDPSVSIIFERYTVKNYTLVRGNVTIFRETSIKKMIVRRYAWERRNWKLKFQVTNNGCNPVFIPVFCAAANVNYDHKTCIFYKGVYTFKDLNMNKIQHGYMSVQEYGRVLWSLEVYSRAGTIFCHQMEVIDEPDSKIKN